MNAHSVVRVACLAHLGGISSFICHLALSSLALSAAEVSVVSPAQAGFSAEKLALVDEFVERQIANQRMVGSIVVAAHNGKVGLFRTYGFLDRESKTPMPPDAIFRLRSMTKPITTVAALRLVDRGQLRLDDPVAKYIRSFAHVQVLTSAGLRAPARQITIRDLMRHTSGLGYGVIGPEAQQQAYGKANLREAPANLAELCDQLAALPLGYEPGTQWMYSYSVEVLGRVIEVVSGEALDAHLKRAIFDPLGMKHTGFRVPEAERRRVAKAYSRTPNGLQPATSDLIDLPKIRWWSQSGGGGLMSTAADYLRFLLMLQNGGELDGHRLLRPETVQLMTTNQLPTGALPIAFPGPGGKSLDGTGFGLGFLVRNSVTPAWDPDAHPGEYGWAGSANTFFWVSPADKLIVITLQQSLPFEWDFGVKKLIYDAILK